MYQFLKTLHPGGIQSRDLLFCRRTRWPLYHAARAWLKCLFIFNKGHDRLHGSVQQCFFQSTIDDHQIVPLESASTGIFTELASCSLHERVDSINTSSELGNGFKNRPQGKNYNLEHGCWAIFYCNIDRAVKTCSCPHYGDLLKTLGIGCAEKRIWNNCFRV
jgi:hypothetical protein